VQQIAVLLIITEELHLDLAELASAPMSLVNGYDVVDHLSDRSSRLVTQLDGGAIRAQAGDLLQGSRSQVPTEQVPGLRGHRAGWPLENQLTADRGGSHLTTEQLERPGRTSLTGTVAQRYAGPGKQQISGVVIGSVELPSDRGRRHDSIDKAIEFGQFELSRGY
jgi:hypothetical protein